MEDILITTTDSVDNYEVEAYLGVVNANFVAGTGFVTDFFASVSDVLGGMSGSYGSEMDRLYERAKWVIAAEAKEKQANAILGYRVDFDEISGKGKSMFMISVTGTAVRLVKKEKEDKQAKIGYRYEIYERLYNLYKFKECGVITEEQYNTEKDAILYAYEEEIKSELEKVKNHNDLQEYERKVKEEARERRAAQMRELDELKAKQREEEEERKRKEAEEFERRRASQDAIKKAQDVFLANSTEIYNEVRALLNLNITNPESVLNSLTLADVKAAQYDASSINSSVRMSYTIGSFIKCNKIAEACKYYIDAIHEDDILAAKSYVQSIYDMITFGKQSAFEKFAVKLVELKFLGKDEDAVKEFMTYSVCDRETAEKVIRAL